ncbi:PmbA protein [Chitinivorax tropicus]|uniref:PmbA protein n=1 Tax=Chitinivorax tropicus TaxID=714531 RepID=A0A840MMR6_9PROT|nr:metalloprotease PmbA [Chitinivorax tropicus]MBB5019700.1 PmbA protein [Chitinivorax tropicus]
MTQSVTPSNVAFAYSREQLASIVQDILKQAATAGATACEAEISEGFGQNVTVRLGEVETIEYNRDKGVGVTVYVGQQKGHASTSDFSPQAVADTVRAALSIARYTASDDCAGLADPALLALNAPVLDLCYPWALPVEQAIELARECEAAAQAADPRISNSEGATVSTQQSHFIYGNSLGFCNGYESSRHSLSASVIAEAEGAMQRDYWYSVARSAADLEPAARVGRIAGERTARRLGARRIDTTQVPVLFEASLAAGLIGSLVSAISGGALYRRSSFLLDSLGKQVCSPLVQIQERPHLAKGLASSPFDAEGVLTRDRDLVADGVLQGYFLGSYSARKLGMQSTGNAGGCHNLLVGSTGEDFAGLLRKMDRGLVVTELLGHGINPVTGDYSRGAAGFWVENGQIQFPVEEVTIAGNLKEMLMGIVAIGNDVLVRGSKQCGSILIDRMTVAGS